MSDNERKKSFSIVPTGTRWDEATGTSCVVFSAESFGLTGVSLAAVDENGNYSSVLQITNGGFDLDFQAKQISKQITVYLAIGPFEDEDIILEKPLDEDCLEGWVFSWLACHKEIDSINEVVQAIWEDKDLWPRRKKSKFRFFEEELTCPVFEEALGWLVQTLTHVNESIIEE